MPDRIPIKNPRPVSDYVGIHTITMTVADGTRNRYPPMTGPVLPAGTVVVTVVPCEYAGPAYVMDLDAVTIGDVGGWIAARPPERRAAIAARMNRVMADLLWLTRERLSEAGLCDPPAVG